MHVHVYSGEDTLRRTGISATEFVRLLEKAVADGSEDAEALLRCVTGLRTEAA